MTGTAGKDTARPAQLQGYGKGASGEPQSQGRGGQISAHNCELQTKSVRKLNFGKKNQLTAKPVCPGPRVAKGMRD